MTKTVKAQRKPSSTTLPAASAARTSRGRPRKSSGESLGIQSVDIALDIIVQMVSHQDSLNLSELSRATGLQPSKLHRYLVSLTRHGFLRQSAVTGQYDFGPFARRIGAAAFNRHHGLGVVQEAVANIAAQSGYSAYLYLWTELGPTVVRMEMGKHANLLTLREGTALPLCGSATGRVFLAYLPASTTKDLVREERAVASREGLRVWSDAELAVEIDKIRSGPIYWTKDAIFPGLLAVLPILDSNGHLNSAITVIPRHGESAAEQTRLLAEILEAHAARLAIELP